MHDEQLIIVAAGGQQYAVPRRTVRELQRAGAEQPLIGLADLLGATTAADEQYALVVAGTERDVAFRVRRADLREALPRFQLPAWLAGQAHPAVCGLILDDTELMPLVDLVQLALQIGYDAP
ncbi:MAG TPA: hypothetical protein VFZ66_25995 [Herpetosiphonaceae bacterium]